MFKESLLKIMRFLRTLINFDVLGQCLFMLIVLFAKISALLI